MRPFWCCMLGLNLALSCTNILEYWLRGNIGVGFSAIIAMVGTYVAIPYAFGEDL